METGDFRYKRHVHWISKKAPPSVSRWGFYNSQGWITWWSRSVTVRCKEPCIFKFIRRDSLICISKGRMKDYRRVSFIVHAWGYFCCVWEQFVNVCGSEGSIVVKLRWVKTCNCWDNAWKNNVENVQWLLHCIYCCYWGLSFFLCFWSCWCCLNNRDNATQRYGQNFSLFALTK